MPSEMPKIQIRTYFPTFIRIAKKVLDVRKSNVKIVGYVLFGMAISAIPYLIAVAIAAGGPGSPESSLGLFFIFVLPLCLIGGSACSGFLIRPLLAKRSALNVLLISPGLYPSIAVLLQSIMSDDLLPGYVTFSVASAVWWIISSYFGTRLGIYRRERKMQVRGR